MSQKTGSAHRHYRLDMPQASSAELADIFAFEGERTIGEPTRYQIRFTHPRPDLSRSDYLNKPAAFVIQPPFNPLMTLKPEPERRVQGVITGFSQRSSSRDETTYEVLLESRLALLRNTPRCRFFLEKSFPEIIEQILREHGFDRIHGSFEFNLYRQYGRRAFVMQWQEDDLTFITRLCRRSGIWFVCEQGKHCENVRFGDDFTHYRRDPDLTVPYRQYSGLESSGAESVDSLEMDATTLPTSYKVRTFSTERPVSEPIEAASRITEDRTTYGEAYTWGTPDLSEDEAKAEALLRREAVVAAQAVYRGAGNMLDLAASCILKFSNRKLPDAEYGLVAVRVKCSASRKQPYRVEFTAIPSDRLYRLPLLEHTWPRIEGVITGTIASPGGYKDPYLDAQGSYIVHIHADQDKRKPGLESCPMRLAKPFAGAGQTGFHFGLVEGTIVTVGFLWGCPDLPFISQVLHTAQDTDPINSTYPWGTRNTLRTRSNNTFQLEDRAGREHIKVATEQGKSQLNLGHSVDRDQNERGNGAELRTDGTSVMRGGAGAMMTAYNRPGGGGHQIDMQETAAQLKEMLALAESLAQSAEASKASPADTSAQRAINDSLNELSQPGALVTAPGPVGIVSGDGVQLAADGSIIATAKKGVHVSTLKQLTAAARGVISLFTQAGMKLVASAGAVVMQAQRGPMQLAAQEDMTIETVDGVVHVKSPKEIVLNVGGSYFRMTPDKIEAGTRGGILFRTSSLKMAGPAQMDLGGTAFAPKFVPFTTDCEVWRTNPKFMELTAPAPAPDTPQLEDVASTGALAPSALQSDSAQPERMGNTGPVAPSPLGDFFSRRGPLKINDPDNSPKGNVGRNPIEYPDPVILKQPASCNWKLDDFNKKAILNRETPTYHKYVLDRSAPIADANGGAVECAGNGTTECQFIYDSNNKTLTAKVMIALVPRLLVKRDPATQQPLRDAQNNYVEVKYHSSQNGANSGKTFAQQGLMLIDRSVNEVDSSTYKNQIESTLNQGGYKLILDGCQKGASCGCRVSVKFCADVHVVSPADAATLKANVTIDIFRETKRADSMHWPETDTEIDLSGMPGDVTWQVKAHETGHLFAFPDEYWSDGGFVHKQYVRSDETLNFDLGDENATKNVTWQIESQPNLMGYGCNHAAAAVQPYYLEYIRQWFRDYTNKEWRIKNGESELPAARDLVQRRARWTIRTRARYLFWTMLVPLLNLILGGTQVMANTVETSTARAGQFALSWGGGLQNGPREISFDGERRFYFATGDTEGSETQAGVGAFELDLQNADLAEVKAAGEILCEKDIQKGGPELSDSSATFSVACLDAGELVIKTGSLHLIPQNLQEKLYPITSKFSDKAYAEGKKLVKLDFSTYRIEVKNGVYVVSVKFINSGNGRVSFTTPDQWTGTAVGGRLGVGGIAKVSSNNVLDKSSRAWQFALGRQKLVNLDDFPDGIVNLNPGEVKILQFQTSPNDKGSKGEYEFSGIAFMNIKCEGERWVASTRVIFNPLKTRVTIDHDYPSTPQEREQWEAKHRADMSFQTVKPGETFAEDGLYRAVRQISGASYRSLQVKPFKAGDIATTENVRMPMESANGVEINGPVQWVWEASAPTRTKPFSSDYIEGTEHVCKPGAPCPRNGRWIERTVPDSWAGNYTYRLSSLITRRAGQQMPQVQGDAGKTEWEWVGA